jgi:putative tryptophan/tyrosine transport system substrate-binding protein
VIFAGDNNAALAAKSATATLPIVFTVGFDPVGMGLVASLNRPDGNLTGFTILNRLLAGKRLELLHEVAPALTSIGYLNNATGLSAAGADRELETATRILGAYMVSAKARTPVEIAQAFRSLVGQRIGALLVSGNPFFLIHRDQIVSLAAHYTLPTVYSDREFVEAGGLMSYGASNSDAFHLAGTYVGRIMKGETPADLPVQQSTRVEMVINLKTAKVLGLTIPSSLLARADEVIE